MGRTSENEGDAARKRRIDKANKFLGITDTRKWPYMIYLEKCNCDGEPKIVTETYEFCGKCTGVKRIFEPFD